MATPQAIAKAALAFPSSTSSSFTLLASAVAVLPSTPVAWHAHAHRSHFSLSQNNLSRPKLNDLVAISSHACCHKQLASASFSRHCRLSEIGETVSAPKFFRLSGPKLLLHTKWVRSMSKCRTIPRRRLNVRRAINLRVFGNIKHADEETDASTSSSLPSNDETIVPTKIRAENERVSEAKAKSSDISKELSKAVRKTASTFAPRASAPQKNPAVPGTTLYTVFEMQGYLSMALGGLLSFNLILPSDEPDIWRLMGMWSVWMFTIPSLRARDCSNKEKDALNYLFLVIPLINIIIPFFWKSFAAVWSADILVFFAMYAWKLNWVQLNAQD